MKVIKGLAIFTCLIASNLAFGGDLSNREQNLMKSSSQEILRLKSKEALLRTILNKTESIQLKDGSVIDFRDLEESQLIKGQGHKLEDLMEAFRAVEGGGTGAGG